MAEDSAATNYKKAMEAKTIGEREENFEKSLEKYLLIYNQNRDVGKHNGYISFNIANCYMNLGQLGQAILYYKEANKLLPENEKISGELKRALSIRVNAVDVKNDSITSKLLFFHFSWSNQLKLFILLICSGIIAVTAFLHIRYNIQYVKSLLLLFLIIYSLFFGSILLKNFNQSNTGVIVTACNIHIDAGENYALINKELIGVGSTIRVLDRQSDWYEVKLNSGQKGYIYKDDLQLVL